jgi:hypothetical protein
MLYVWKGKVLFHSKLMNLRVQDATFLKINGVFADVTEGISPPSHRQRFIILRKTLEGQGGAGFILPSELMARKGAQAQRKRTCLIL